MTDLGTLPGGKFSEATDINNSGQIIGISSAYSDGRDYFSHAFLYSGGQMIDLGTLGGSYSTATAINDSGQIVGYSKNGNDVSDAFLYSNGKMTDLNSLIPQDSGWTLSDATAINNFGQILGDGYIGGENHQFLLSPISTTATPKDGITTVGNISTQGSSVLLQGLKINLTGSKVVTKGGNITFDGPTILNSSTGAYTFNSAKSTATDKGGDITFKNTLDSNSAGASSLSLTGGLGNITFNNAVGGNASLKDLTVNSAKTFTVNADITSKGNITVITTQDITTKNLTSNKGTVKITSQQGTVATIDITSGSNTTVTASQNLSTGNVLVNSGAVSLTSKLGAVTTKDITTSGNADDITLKAASDISTANLSANGSGKVSIFLNKDTNSENQPSGDITTGSITAKQLEILSSGAVTTSGDITTSGGIIIAAVGDINTRNIRAQNGVVGLFSSLGAVTTQGNIITSSYTIAPQKSLVGSYALGNIEIITTGVSGDKSLQNPGAVNFDTLIDSAIGGTLEANNPPGIGPGPMMRPGNQPFPYYIGNEAHKGIAAFYAEMHEGELVFTNYVNTKTILKTYQDRGETSNIDALSPKEQDAKPDILNVPEHTLYEIKSQTQSSLALPEAQEYAAIFAKAGITINLGSSTDPGTYGVISAPGGYYTFASPQAGTIIYQYKKGTFSSVSENQTQQSDSTDPIELIKKYTGLTGAALFVYIVVSEGSRILLPPRNFVPIP